MNWANRITVFRIVLAPVFLALFGLHRAYPSILLLGALLVIFLLSELSDLLDGMVARKFNLTSDLGKLLDPFSDVISRLTIFLCLLLVGIAPLAVFAIVLYREFSMIFLRMLMVRHGHVQAAKMSGKIKAWFYFFASLVGLVYYGLQSMGMSGTGVEAVFWAAQVLFWLSAVLAVWSFVFYLKAYGKLRHESRS